PFKARTKRPIKASRMPVSLINLNDPPVIKRKNTIDPTSIKACGKARINWKGFCGLESIKWKESGTKTVRSSASVRSNSPAGISHVNTIMMTMIENKSTNALGICNFLGNNFDFIRKLLLKMSIKKYQGKQKLDLVLVEYRNHFCLQNRKCSWKKSAIPFWQ